MVVLGWGASLCLFWLYPCYRYVPALLPITLQEHSSRFVQAYAGLLRAIGSDGVVSGICEGTGIEPDAQAYRERSTDYLKSSPGLGSVLYALVDYQRLHQHRARA